MRKVITNYEKLSQADFDEFLNFMIPCMTGNANFPTPPVDLTTITTKQTDWKKELNKSKAGSHEATAKANDIKDELIRDVKENGDYVNNTAKGDVPKLESSGYTLAKEPVYQPKPDVKIVQGEHTGSGTVVIEAIPEAVTYLVEIAPDPIPAPDNQSKWVRQKMSTRSSIPFSGLEPGKLYWVKYCYLTVEGESDYSQPKSFRVN